MARATNLTDPKGDTITEADRFVLSMFYGNLQFFLRNPPAGLSADTESGLDVALLLLEQDVQKVEAMT
jgi:hypothetical protein